MAGHQHELGSSGAPSRLSLASARRARSQTTSASKGNDGTVGDVGDVTVGGGDWARRRWRSDLRRLQLHRVKGWRLPIGAIVVARPSRWGNPRRVVDRTGLVGGAGRRFGTAARTHVVDIDRSNTQADPSPTSTDGPGSLLPNIARALGDVSWSLRPGSARPRRVGPGIGPANWTTGASALPEPRLTAVVFIGMRCDDPAAVARAGGERPHGNRMLRCDRQ